jgi:hypothetical protein
MGCGPAFWGITGLAGAIIAATMAIGLPSVPPSRYDRKTWSVLWPERKSKIKNIYWYIRWWANMRTCQWINCDLFNYLVEIVYPNRLVPKDNIWLEPSGVYIG